MDATKKATLYKQFRVSISDMTVWGWAIVATLGVLLALAAIIAYLGWTSAPDTIVPPAGYVAMALGILFSLLIGVSLMSLLFYSSRHGYDDAPVPENEGTLLSPLNDEQPAPPSSTSQARPTVATPIRENRS
jgi:hypothetical protein